MPDQAGADEQIRRAGRNRPPDGIETEGHALNRPPFLQVARLALAVSVLALFATAPVRAQAWVPARGESTISLTYQNYDVAGHFDVQGRKNTNGGTQSHAVVAEMDYGITDTFAVIVGLPFIASKYTGPPVYFVGGHETHPGPLDDGNYHGAFQDARLELRRLFWAGAVPIAPFVGASFPTHNYETVGEAVPGRHRRDLQVGANVGLDLARLVPGSYVHARYAFATAERAHDFPYIRSNIDVEGGYALTSRVVLRAVMNRQIRHRGPTLAELAPDWEHHDRFIAPNYLNLGGGAAISLSQSIDVYALLLGTVSGNNGAHRARTFAAGVTFGIASRLRGLGGTGGGQPSPAVGARPEFTRQFPWGPGAAGYGM